MILPAAQPGNLGNPFRAALMIRSCHDCMNAQFGNGLVDTRIIGSNNNIFGIGFLRAFTHMGNHRFAGNSEQWLAR